MTVAFYVGKWGGLQLWVRLREPHTRYIRFVVGWFGFAIYSADFDDVIAAGVDALCDTAEGAR